jgi:hypothetical protein
VKFSEGRSCLSLDALICCEKPAPVLLTVPSEASWHYPPAKPTEGSGPSKQHRRKNGFKELDSFVKTTGSSFA